VESTPAAPPPTEATAPPASAPGAVATAPPTAAPTAPPLPFVTQGRGDNVVAIAKPTGRPEDRAVVRFTHNGTRNFIVTGLDASGGRVDLLVNTIGAYDGTVALDFRSNQRTTMLDVKADGDWSVQVNAVSAVLAFNPITQGRGDSVLAYTGPNGVAAINHSGSSNFIVSNYPTGASFADLVVNEIGPYSGRRPFKGPSLVVIRADGDWTINLAG
jgi:hypothetical protein